VVLAFLTIPLMKRLRRRWALARARDGRERVLVAYRTMADRARDVGIRRDSSETLDEFRERLLARVVFSDGHLGRLTALADLAAYSQDEVDDDQAIEAVEAARVAGGDIERSAGRLGRVVGWYRIRIPLLRR
jgi:hypothetical protein